MADLPLTPFVELFPLSPVEWASALFVFFAAARLGWLIFRVRTY